MKNRKKKAAAAVFVTLLAAAAIPLWLRRGTLVAVVPVEQREVVEVYVATGRLSAPTTAAVGSELAGRVAAVHVVEGDRPFLGQPLVDLQPVDEKLAVQQAEARVAIAAKELERAKRGATLAQIDEARAGVTAAQAELEQASREQARAEAMKREGVGTPAELERATTGSRRAQSALRAARARLSELRQLPLPEDLRVAEARLAEARTGLEQALAVLGKTTIRAPFDGLVLSVDATRGESVSPGQSLITIASTEAMEVYAEVDEDYFGRLAAGQPATLVFGALPARRFTAEVARVGPEVDSTRGVVGVHLTPAQLPEGVVPGLTLDVAIELARLEGAYAVPRMALVRDDGDAFVFVVDNHAAARRAVQILAEGEDYFAVDGLHESSIIANATSVRDGDTVRIERGR